MQREISAPSRSARVPLAPWLILALLLAACMPAPAQSSSGGGTIQGVVKDVSGAVVASAKVTILHIESGVVTSTATNGEGFFATPPLPIGRYRVRIESPGMNTWAGELTVEVGRAAEISPSLAPGNVAETIVVNDAAPLVTTTDATEASMLDNRRIAELPIDGRNLSTLLQDTTPGVEYGFSGVNDGVRTAGMAAHSTNYTQDGATSNNRELGGSSNLQGLESMGEVRIEVSTSSAKYSTPASVIITTKSGGNRIHGSLYETARNNAVGVARARQDVNLDGTPYQVPKLIRNEFGGSVGGPVMLPSFGWNGKRFYDGRNRTFFFFSREGLELRQGVTRTFTVPTLAMRDGDFSAALDSQGRRYTIYDPLTTRYETLSSGRVVAVRDPFPNNRIAAARMSPLAKRLHAITPVPNDITNPLVTTNLRIAVPTNAYPNTSDNPTTLRLDHRFTDRDNTFFKINGGTRTASFLGTSGSVGAPTLGEEANISYRPVKALAVALNWTHVFNPGFFVETFATRTWQRNSMGTGPVEKNWASELGLQNPYGDVGWPNITGANFMSYIEGDARRYVRSNITNLGQNYSWIRGTHNVQFGVSYQNDLENVLPDRSSISGATVFSNLPTALENPAVGSISSSSATTLTGLGAASLYLGYLSTHTVTRQRPLLRLTQNRYGLFVQDSYKVNQRLTLTPGFRWDITPMLTERHNLLSSFDLASHSTMLGEPLDYYYGIGATTPQIVAAYNSVDVKFTSAAAAGRGSLLPSNCFDIGPRIGVAYRLFEGNRQLVLRGGYGLYFSGIPMRTLISASTIPFSASYSYNPNNASQSPDGYSNYLLRSTPTIIAGANTATAVDLTSPTAIGRGVAVTALGDLPSMRVHEWNVSLEKQLSASTVIRVRYNGRRGVNSDQLNNINPTRTDYVWYTLTGQPLPSGAYASVARRPYDQTAYTDVRVLRKTGYFNSALFTLEVERRFTNGLGFQAFYTVSNVVGIGINNLTAGVNGSVPEAYLPGAVPTDPAELNRFLNYARDTAIPKHRMRWNWTYELPLGRGRKFARSLPRALDAAVGGWKLSGGGNMLSTWFAMPTSYWGEASSFEVYGEKYPILDCRGTPASAISSNDERCIPGYLWFNGYISERYRESYNAAGLRNGVFGLPPDYQPAQKPVVPWPKNGKPGDPGSGYWDTNTVFVTLKNGTTVQTTPDTGLHPWRNQFRLGPFNWTTNASLMKTFFFRERVRFRVAVDVFNVFNYQGFNPPGADGIVTLGSSYTGLGYRPRQVQFSGRLEW